MSNPVRARGHDWQLIDNVFCLVLHGEDKRTSIAIPIGTLQTLAADSRRRQMAMHKRMVSEGSAAAQDTTPLRQDMLLPVQTWSVGTADNGMLVLMLDRGLDTEVLLGLSAHVAEILADLFIKNTRDAP
jgi:hypothetical protein